MISFIVPAFNEEAVLGATLAQLEASARASGEAFEVIVVDDASEDRTAQIAVEHGARLVAANLRQIAAVRNRGASQACGDTFVFVDADTIVPEETLAAALEALHGGAVGGGASVGFDAPLPLSSRLPVAAILIGMRLGRYAAGCFIFTRRAAFEAVGGFDERYFASEEIHLSRALKRQGRFVLLRQKVTTSARKLRLLSAADLTKAFLRLAVTGPKGLRRRRGLDVWYDGTLREADRPKE